MVIPSLKEQDGFTQNFDSLIDLHTRVATDTMAPISLVPGPGSQGPFDFDYSRQHTLDHQDCPACQAANEALQVNAADMAGMIFSEASKLWILLRAQSQSLRPRTHETTQGYLDALGKFFGRLRMRDITPGHMRSYQIARLHNALQTAGGVVHPWKRQAGHSIINHELSVIGQMLKFCLLRHRIKPYYSALEMPNWSPRTVLTEDEEEQLWKTASKHPEAALAYWVATITNNTSAAGIELRGLRLKHLFLYSDGISEIYIPEDSVKNNSRPRKIPLNPTAKWAVEQCYERALRLGSCEPDHYLFPFRTKRNLYDPTRAPSRWFLRKSWDKLREATGFTNLNPHDLRHQFATRMLESDVDIETTKAIMGHVNPKMTEYYAHQRRGVKYAAVLAMEGKKKPPVSETAIQRFRRGTA